MDSCTPILSPHRADPMMTGQKPPRNTSGAKQAETIVSGTKMRDQEDESERHAPSARGTSGHYNPVLNV